MILSRSASFAGLQLAGVPFSLEPADVSRLATCADALDAVLPGVAEWRSYSEPAGDPEPGIRTTLLERTVTLESGPSDWLEFDLYVAHGEAASLQVGVEAEVACWCPTDHNIHVVEEHAWLVGGGEALAESIDEAARILRRWVTEQPHDPEPWRIRAGLPGRDMQPPVSEVHDRFGSA